MAVFRQKISVDGKTFAQLSKGLQDSVEVSLKLIAADFSERAKLNASIDTGRLRQSIKGEVVQDGQGNPAAVVSADAPYALIVHETNAPAEQNRGPGPRTARQPFQPETAPGPVFTGGLFFKRVSDFRAAEWRRFMAETIQAQAAGKRPKKPRA